MTATIEKTQETGRRPSGRIAASPAVVDVEFPVDSMPEIYNRLRPSSDGW